MDVRGGDEAARADNRLEDDPLAVRLGRRLVEDEALAGDGVLDRVSNLDHLLLLSS
jgi:hypothetical protein